MSNYAIIPLINHNSDFSDLLAASGAYHSLVLRPPAFVDDCSIKWNQLALQGKVRQGYFDSRVILIICTSTAIFFQGKAWQNLYGTTVQVDSVPPCTISTSVVVLPVALR